MNRPGGFLRRGAYLATSFDVEPVEASERRVYAAAVWFASLLPPEGGVPEAVSRCGQLQIFVSFGMDGTVLCA